jgi:uncharacterized protein
MELDKVIAQSTFRVVADTYWMHGEPISGAPDLAPASQQPGTPACTIWAVVTDETERTTIVSSPANPGAGDAEYYGPLRAIRIRPSMPFNAPGFLAAATSAIAANNVSILAISTYSYDYIFTRSEHLATVITTLAARGFIQDRGN